MKKRSTFKIKPVFLLFAAAILLLASTVGSTQAALTYYSDNYIAQVNVSNIDVTLLENGKIFSDAAHPSPHPPRVTRHLLLEEKAFYWFAFAFCWLRNREQTIAKQ